MGNNIHQFGTPGGEKEKLGTTQAPFDPSAHLYVYGHNKIFNHYMACIFPGTQNKCIVKRFEPATCFCDPPLQPTI